MTVSISFPDVRIPDGVPVLAVASHSWAREADSLVTSFGVDAELTDAGLWQIARGERSALELYAATPSFRFSRFDLDDEGRSGEGRVDRETALRLAEEWLGRFGPAEGKPELHSVTEQEVLVSESGQTDDPDRRLPASEARSLIVATDVNYTFGYEGLPLLGPGAKVKVSIHPSGEVSGAYRFWRGIDPVATTPTRSADELLERFVGSELFAGLNDETARARVDDARFGWLCLPPTEHMNVLLPALEVRGSLETEAQTYDFTSYVAATRSDEADVKSNWRVNARPGLITA